MPKSLLWLTKALRDPGLATILDLPVPLSYSPMIFLDQCFPDFQLQSINGLEINVMDPNWFLKMK